MEYEIESNVFDHEEEVGEKFPCEFCGKTFSNLRNLTKHRKIHAIEAYTCDQRGKSFTTKHYLSAHMKRHLKKEHLCPHCGKQYFSRSGLINHIRYKHTDAGHACSICNKQLKDKYALRRHEKCHSDEKEMCQICFRLFKDVKSHEPSCTVKKSKNFKCGSCGETFVEKTYLTRHVKNKHEMPNVYSCACGKTYKYMFSFKRHQSQKCSQSQTEINF